MKNKETSKDNLIAMLITLFNIILFSILILFGILIKIKIFDLGIFFATYGFQICFFIWCTNDYVRLKREEKIK